MSFLNRFLPQPPQDDALGSVVRNLGLLLNSRREYGSLLCSFGLADYLAEQGGPNTALAILREIKQTIGLYEPRLRVLDLKSLGRDSELWLHIDLEGLLLLPYGAVPCRLLLLFHPITGAVEIPRPPAPAQPARPPLPSPLPQIPPGILAAVSRAAEVGVDSLVTSNPELAPVLVVGALVGQAGLLPQLLAGPAAAAGAAALEAQADLALLLTLVGQAGRAGLLPPALTGLATRAGKLALTNNPDVAELSAQSAVAAQSGVVPAELRDPLQGAPRGRAALEMMLLANLAAQQGLLAPSVAAAIAHSPRLAFATTAELAGALGITSLAAQLVGVIPQVRLPEDSDGS